MIKLLVGRIWALGRVGGGRGGIEELHTSVFSPGCLRITGCYACKSTSIAGATLLRLLLVSSQFKVHFDF